MRKVNNLAVAAALFGVGIGLGSGMDEALLSGLKQPFSRYRSYRRQEPNSEVEAAAEAKRRRRMERNRS